MNGKNMLFTYSKPAKKKAERAKSVKSSESLADKNVAGGDIFVDDDLMEDYRPDKPLTPAEATRAIRGIARIGEIIESGHCRDESMPERSFEYQDLVAVLLNGEVKDPPKPDEKTGDHRYEVIGETIEGDSAIAVTIILSHRAIKIVTIYSR